MKQFLRLWFSFSRKELNGILVLFVFIVLLIFSNFYLERIFINEPIDFKKFNTEIAAFEAQCSQDSKLEVKQGSKVSEKKVEVKRSVKLFAFNPNNLSEADWKLLGLSDKQIHVIKNYESKGGHFYRKEDLKKMYSISAEEYARLEPYITLSSKEKSKSQTIPSNKAQQMKIIELNASDSLALVGLPGIGPAFATRIIKYRNRLGGFYQKEQLMEVYGLDSMKYSSVENLIKVDASTINKVNINSAEFSDLKRFPYWSYKQINVLLNYRKQHGSFKTVDDLMTTGVIDKNTLVKLAPYLLSN
ncbi:ComEA family DNA-binding protein [Solitalea koreensis]|uniref:DNA uptake protein ComE n=1 Tax=Solitalea koreensis TaxID=543615 RepID=A0A521DSM5_9SPHI|nr:helix-hairpin-helix domain-containing protein [Solitalea koreensis]SMO74605.1 DNA uptake protein ComE [Solitalea koreensis]